MNENLLQPPPKKHTMNNHMKKKTKKNEKCGGEQEVGRAQMQTEEARIRQAAGLLRNSALTFTGQAATGDENLCTLSLCIIGSERRGVCTRGCTCATEGANVCARARIAA